MKNNTKFNIDVFLTKAVNDSVLSLRGNFYFKLINKYLYVIYFCCKSVKLLYLMMNKYCNDTCVINTTFCIDICIYWYKNVLLVCVLLLQRIILI